MPMIAASGCFGLLRALAGGPSLVGRQVLSRGALVAEAVVSEIGLASPRQGACLAARQGLTFAGALPQDLTQSASSLLPRYPLFATRDAQGSWTAAGPAMVHARRRFLPSMTHPPWMRMAQPLRSRI